MSKNCNNEQTTRFMKRILFIILTTLIFCSKVYAQSSYYNYQLPSVDQLATSMYNSIVKDICNDNLYKRDYRQLFKFCYNDIYKKKTGEPSPASYFYMGACLEMGLGGCEISTYKAKAHYEKGASLGDKNCKQRLKSIRTNGFWKATAATREAFAKKYGKPGHTPNPPGPNPPGPTPNDGRTCRGCSGTGRCTYCGGEGKVWVDAGTYVPYDHHVRKTCSACGGSGRCKVCYGQGKIR